MAQAWTPSSFAQGDSSASSTVNGDTSAGRPMSAVQKAACLVSHILALISMIIVVVWVNHVEMGGGGVSWEQGDAGRVFNWHPVMMICTFCFMTVASLTFRVRSGILWGHRYTDRRFVKLMHGLAWAVALLCGFIGLVAVFKSHNDPESGYIANMYSLHSWIGLTLIIVFLYQIITATAAFACNLPQAWMSAGRRASIFSFHPFLGMSVYIATAATILLGIQEKEGFIGCAYSVQSADVFPPEHLMEISSVCRVGHSLGLVVLSMAASTSYAMYAFPETGVQQSSRVI